MRDADFGYRIAQELVEEENRKIREDLEKDYDALGEGLRRNGRLGRLGRLGMDLDGITDLVSKLEVALPSWGLAAGGTRSGEFPLPGEPRSIFEKLVDAAAVHRLCGAAPRVALHMPWDRVDDPRQLLEFARHLGLSFDAVNSSTFQDRPGQARSSRSGSLGCVDPEVRAQAVEQNLECIDFGRAVGSDALNVWIGDGGGFPGQIHFRRSLERTIESLRQVSEGLPEGWRLFLERKPFDPALASAAIGGWGTSYAIASALGERASCFLDLGHGLPSTGAERVVARWIALDKFGGIHCNDSMPAAGGLTAASIHPYALFLVFCELVDAENDPEVDRRFFRPAYLADRSQDLKDPAEELLQTAEEIWRAYAKALLVDRQALAAHQERNDAVAAELVLQEAYETDVRPILRMARVRKGAAADPIAVFRRALYREEKARERKPGGAAGGGAV